MEYRLCYRRSVATPGLDSGQWTVADLPLRERRPSLFRTSCRVSGGNRDITNGTAACQPDRVVEDVAQQGEMNTGFSCSRLVRQVGIFSSC